MFNVNTIIRFWNLVQIALELSTRSYIRWVDVPPFCMFGIFIEKLKLFKYCIYDVAAVYGGDGLLAVP